MWQCESMNMWGRRCAVEPALQGVGRTRRCKGITEYVFDLAPRRHPGLVGGKFHADALLFVAMRIFRRDPDHPARHRHFGRVVWITPKDAHGNKQQGVGVEFSADESGVSARRKIENVLGNSLASTRPTHTL